MNILRIAAVAAFTAVPLLASADPLVAPGGKPGAAKSWSAKGTTVTLTLADGFSAEEAAKAISKGVPGASAKAEGTSTVIVSGLEESKLISALEKVDVAGEDVDQMFATLRGAGGDGEGSGSSIRATSAKDFSEVIKDPEAKIAAVVVEVKHGTYPHVAVTVKIDQPLKDSPIKKGEVVTVVPRITVNKGVIAKDDEQSKTNVGAWYAKKGDKVQLKLEGKTKQGFWVAERFERVK
jgi:hypothetical protein